MKHVCDATCELHLDAIDAWYSGRKATPAAPSGSNLYASRMKGDVMEHVRKLREHGHHVPTDMG